MRRILGAVACVLSLSGCASTINALSNRPITSDHLEEPGEGQKLKTVSGDRRLVRVNLIADASGRPIYRICAETQADAISARTGTSKITVTGRGDFDDSLAEALTKTNERGQISDVVRQLAWQWCNAEINGMLAPGTFENQMKALQEKAMEALKERKGQQ